MPVKGRKRALQVGQRVFLRRPTPGDEEEFLDMVRRSRRLHQPYVHPPDTPELFERYLRLGRRINAELHLVCTCDDGGIAGVYNISEIIRGPLQSAFLGYYGAVPYEGRGYMSEGMRLLLRQAFERYKLHRLEANIMPENTRSIALAERNGFRREGYSPRYLKIGGRWRDHIRFAVLVEDWRGQRKEP